MEPNINNEEEYLKELSPSLFDEKLSLKPEPPEGYFESFAERLSAKLPKQEEAKVRKVSIVNLRNLAIAATVAALVALIPFFTQDDKLNNTMNDNAYKGLAVLDLNEEDVSDYLEMDLIIEMALEDEDFNIGSQIENNESEIVNFLMDEDISEDLIINEYTENDTL